MSSPLVPAILALLPAIVALISARPWLTARNKRMEYFERRLTLVKSMLADHRDRLEPNQIAAIESEVKFIANDMIASSDRSEEKRILRWSHQAIWKKLFTLPRPQSLTNWIANALFYLYLVCGIFYLVVMLPWVLVQGQKIEELLQLEVVIWGIIGSFVICALARKWSLSIARKRTISGRKIGDVVELLE